MLKINEPKFIVLKGQTGYFWSSYDITDEHDPRRLVTGEIVYEIIAYTISAKNAEQIAIFLNRIYQNGPYRNTMSEL
ncbi:MAG: hypothetical protein AABY22_35610 [Nanoarchaeota archaeon]